MEAISERANKLRGTGFAEISFPEVPEDVQPPAVVWRYLADMTTILEDYSSGGSMQSRASVILDQMQFTQHSLLSLPPASDLGGQDQEKDRISRVYEITRLACICYANLVTYPTDYSTFPRLRVARLVLAQLESLYEDRVQLSAQEHRLVFWATILGAIMAVGYDNERVSFVASVARSAKDSKIRSWAEAKQLVESFVWHSQTSDTDVLQLWIEVQKLTSRGSSQTQVPERLASKDPRPSE
jgi:hypothetical protein